MSAVAVAALGKIVGQSLKGRLVVILWNHPVNSFQVGAV
jgi:hypothetical protein